MELREGYKNTEVGVIFEDWEVKSLDRVSKLNAFKGFYFFGVVLFNLFQFGY